MLDTWKQLIDDGLGQVGQLDYSATARPAVIKANSATLEAAGIQPGAMATITTSNGSITLPTEAVEMADEVVWVPTNNGAHVSSTLGAVAGQSVTLSGGAA